MPPEVVEILRAVHGVGDGDPHRKLWQLCRSRAWRLVKAVMRAAGIAQGPHATPKGLRHGFGLHAIRSGVPLNLVQKWLGHASLSTTSIYLQAAGAEEREFAVRMWGSERERRRWCPITASHRLILTIILPFAFCAFSTAAAGTAGCTRRRS